MASLVSPGVSVTIVDESFYIPAAAPTVPLFFIATQNNKLQPNGVSPAEGTHEFGMIRTVTSIGQSVSLYGVPSFLKDSGGNPFHGDARNEYGLFALNQYLGIGSYAYVVRANIDLTDAPETYVSLGIPAVLSYDFVGVGGDVPVVGQPGRFSGRITGFQAVNPLPVAQSELTKPEEYTIVITQAATFTTTGDLASEAEYTVTGSKSGIIGTGVINGAFAAGDFDSEVIDLKVQLNRAGGVGTFQEYVEGDYFTFSLEYVATPDVANSSPLAGVFTDIAVETGYELPLGDTETFTITMDTPTTYTVSSSNVGAHANQGGVVGSLFEHTGLGITFTLSNGAIGSGLPNLVTGDKFTITAKGVMRANPLGANDAAKRATICMALAQQITSNTEVRSTDVFEYNLILCPGYWEVVPQLVLLSKDIDEEAFVIADTPSNNTPEQIASYWSTTSGRAKDRAVGYYYPWGIARNLDGAEVLVSASGIAARAFAYNDEVGYPWFAPAGARRGVVSGINRLGYVSGELGGATLFVESNLNQGQRDILYKSPSNINPIVNFPAQGMVIWGQKTSQGVASALDRINVERLCIYLKRALRKGGFPFVFEPNDQITRDNLKAAIDGLLNDVMSKRGLYDFVTISDDSNNTPYRIDNNELWVDIAIKPVKAAEFIYIPIRVLSTGATMPG